MKKEFLWSQRLGFSNQQAFAIQKLGMERFLQQSFQAPFNTSIPELLSDSPKSLEDLKKIRQTRKEDSEAGKELLKKEIQTSNELKAWWIDEMKTSEFPLREKMTLFWENHFVTAYQKVKVNYWIFQKNQLLRENAFGNFFQEYVDVRLAFSFTGIVIASIIANLPFMIQPLQNGFSALPDELRQVSYTMGKSKLVTLFRVLIPNMKASVITGIALTFAHCIGEFGIVIMVGGNIPKETRIASVAIYDQVQALNFEVANQYAFVLFIISFIILLLIYSVNKNFKFTPQR